MTHEEIDELLRQTLDDRRLSRGERHVLSELLGDLAPDEQKLGFYRHRAFEIARAALSTADSRRVLEWLEEVVKVLLPRDAASAAPGSIAFFSPQDDCPGEIVKLLKRARRSVDICVFTITDNRITAAIRAAHRRKVALRIITDNEKAEDAGSDADELLRAGIPLRFDNSSHHMHHKFAIFDKTLLLTGSYNWTRSAADNNEENFIVSEERALIVRFSRVFEKLWQEFS